MTNLFIKQSLKNFGQFTAVLPLGYPSNNRVPRLHRRWPPSYKKHCMVGRLVSLGIWTAYMAEYPAKFEAKAPLGKGCVLSLESGVVTDGANFEPPWWAKKNLITIFLHPRIQCLHHHPNHLANTQPPSKSSHLRSLTTILLKTTPGVTHIVVINFFLAPCTHR